MVQNESGKEKICWRKREENHGDGEKRNRIVFFRQKERGQGIEGKDGEREEESGGMRGRKQWNQKV